ncbi:MAG: carboxypeptidase-like regulatory domain-containing protein [Bdellovibrionota bacterium]
MDNFRLENVFNIISRAIFGSVIALPLSLSNYSLSHQEGLSLKYSKTAPPLAIFDDERITPHIDEEFVSNNTKQVLETNRLQTRKIVLKISRKFAALQKAAVEEAKPKVQARMLAGLSLQKSSSSIAIINKPSNPEKQMFAATLPTNLRDRVEEIENFDEILEQDYGTESFEARAKTALASAGVDPEAPTEREIANTYGTNTGARKSYSQRRQQAAERATRQASNFSRSGYTKGSGKRSPPLPTAPSDEIIDEKGNKESNEGITVASRGNQRQALIAGNLEVTKGLALTGTQKIVVYRQIGGTKYEYGQVFLDKGRYEIYVNEPNTGVVIAELLENDTMVGRAEILMPEVMLNIKSDADLKNVPIKIAPILDQVVAQNISAYSYYKKEKLNNSQIRISDALNANIKVFNSSVIVKATKENHWGNIILGSSKQLFTHVLNPDATIQALKDILGIRTPKEQMGIIKGEVLISGKHVAGAEVEIIGQESIKPVYFNSFIPDASLTSTTANGEYAFPDIPEGNYLVRAKYKGKYLSPQVAPVEPGFITQVQFDVQKPALAEAFIFDIQSSEMMSANISFLGSETKVPVQARKLISFSGTDGVQFLEVQSPDQNYYSTRVTVDKSEKEILIPMISQSWLNALMSRLKVTVIPETGLVIGTALELSYSVELDPGAYNEDTKIIYFDNQGRLVPGAMITPVGGGFVAVNVNPGIRSLFNKYHGTQNLKITTMAVDSSAINVFSTKF